MKGAKFDFSETIRKSLALKQSEEDQLNREGLIGRKVNATTKIDIAELEFALTVLLVELASSDENFDQGEYHTITLSLQRIFNTDRTRAKEFINRASVSLSQVRGTTSFARVLRDNLALEDRKMIVDIIDELVHSDGNSDPFELYHQNRIRHILLPEEVDIVDDEE